ncbi:MAG TPA: sigma factor, partial [Streptosporangiaceae bacterium]
MSDAELAARFGRDPDQFTAVYDRHFRDIYLYVAGRLDVQAAEDIAAETFCVAFGQRDRFGPVRGSLPPWLSGIATNLVARHRRKEARHYRALAHTGAEPAADQPREPRRRLRRRQGLPAATGEGPYHAVPGGTRRRAAGSR